MRYLVSKQQLSSPNYETCTVQESLSYLSNLEEIAVDTETLGFDPYTCALISLQIGDGTNQYFIDTATIDIQNYKELLESKLLVMQNGKFDLRFLYHHRIIPTRIYDTYLAERTLYLGIDSHRAGLDSLCREYLGVVLDKEERKNISARLTESLIVYGCKDVEYLLEIKRIQQGFIKEKELEVSIELDNRFVKVLAYIEYCGIYLDPQDWEIKCQKDLEALKQATEELDNFILNNPEQYRKYIDNQLSLFDEGITCKLNWASSHQVIPFMQSLGVDTKTKDKETGLWKDSVEKKVIAPQQHLHPIIKVYLKFTECQKVVSTYGHNWFSYINPVTGRIHTNYNQIMNTGRLSSGQKGNPKKGIQQLPNMQNIPSDTATRNCFKAQKGNTLIVCDYSGQETIVLVNKCLDPDLLSFYRQGLSDMHSFIASKIFPELEGLSVDEIKEKHKHKRTIAKSAGFAINYGGVGMTIAQNLNISLEEGEAVYNAYFKAFPGLAQYFKEEKTRAVKTGYIQFNNISGRKSFVPYFEDFERLQKDIQGDKKFWEKYRTEKALNSDTFNLELKPKVRQYFIKKGEIERMSLNFPIQGTSSEITKLAGIYLFEYLQENNLLFDVLIPNTIHDEYIVECRLELQELMKNKLQECMEKAGDVFCKTIKLKADPMITSTWQH